MCLLFITSSLSIFSFVTVNQICDVKINFGPTFLFNTTTSRKVLLLKRLYWAMAEIITDLVSQQKSRQGRLCINLVGQSG